MATNNLYDEDGGHPFEKCPKCGEEHNLHYNYDWSKKDALIMDVLCNECGEIFRGQQDSPYNEPEPEKPILKFFKHMVIGSCDDGSTRVMGRNSDSEPWEPMFQVDIKPEDLHGTPVGVSSRGFDKLKDKNGTVIKAGDRIAKVTNTDIGGLQYGYVTWDETEHCFKCGETVLIQEYMCDFIVVPKRSKAVSWFRRWILGKKH